MIILLTIFLLVVFFPMKITQESRYPVHPSSRLATPNLYERYRSKLHCSKKKTPCSVGARKLYEEFKSKYNLHFGKQEDSVRFHLFCNHLKEILELNKASEGTASFNLNFFSVMTQQEMEQHSDGNVTKDYKDTDTLPIFTPKRSIVEPISHEKMWLHGVTPVKDQGWCRSCWAFSAVAAIEGGYYRNSGKLISLSEQELIDCAIENMKGCKGATVEAAFRYCRIFRDGGLAANDAYPSKRKASACKNNLPVSALVSYKIKTYKVIKGEENSIRYLSTYGPIAAYTTATIRFYFYSTGILEHKGRMGFGHYVTLVGYTPDFVLAKNSWGKGWGEDGFIKFSRYCPKCNFYEANFLPVFEETGIPDERTSEKATKYDPDKCHEICNSFGCHCKFPR